MSTKYTSKSQKVGECRYFGKKFEVLPGIIDELGLSLQNTFGYRRMIKKTVYISHAKKFVRRRIIRMQF